MESDLYKTVDYEAIATELTKITGEEWAIRVKGMDTYYPDIYLEKKDGYGQRVNLSTRFGGKFTIKGIFDHIDPQPKRIRNWFRYEHNPTATCSFTRKPIQIAKDIVKKILPKYLELAEEVYEAGLTPDQKIQRDCHNIQEQANILSQRLGIEAIQVTWEKLSNAHHSGSGSRSVELKGSREQIEKILAYWLIIVEKKLPY